jgi:hypothetical protein
VLISLAYVALSGFDVRVIWPTYPVAVIVGSAGAFTNPARSSMLPQLVSRAQLQNGVILGTTLGFVAALELIGPSIGGIADCAASRRSRPSRSCSPSPRCLSRIRTGDAAVRRASGAAHEGPPTCADIRRYAVCPRLAGAWGLLHRPFAVTVR